MPILSRGKPNFREIDGRACRELVESCHYSKRMPSVVKFCLADVDYGPPRRLFACCMFSNAIGRWEIPDLWELSRLVRMPGYDVPMTKLIAEALAKIRKSKATDLIVSFADAEEDHHGGVYQAASWIYDGMRHARLDGFNVDGVFVPARTCVAKWGTSSEVDLPKRLPNKAVEPHFDLGKHCYWKALTKEGMRKAVRCGLSSRPYPKPMLAESFSGNGSDRNYGVAGHLRKGVVDLRAQEKAPIPMRLDIGADLDLD